jgi:hypothetical protein
MSDIPKKHWTAFLSEVGSPLLKQGYRQLYCISEIRRKEMEVRLLKMEFEEAERELTSIAINDWTFEEITEAKNKYNALHKSDS